MPALLALAAACTFGVGDFLGGLATRRAAVVAVTFVSNLAGVLLAALLVVVVDGVWSAEAVVWGALCGALVNLFPATTVLLAVAVLGERLNRTQRVGLVLAVVVAAVLSSS